MSTFATNAQWYQWQDGRRSTKLERARSCASVTIPGLMPPESTTDDVDIKLPYSSEAARGVNKLASKIMQVLMPLNNQPFFRLVDNTGIEREPAIQDTMATLASQVYSVITRGNLRETMMRVLQHLIVVGDVLLVQDGLDTFRLIRLDQYVTSRDADGFLRELGYITWVIDPDWDTETQPYQQGVPTGTPYHREGYKTVFVRVTYDQTTGMYRETREYYDGTEAFPPGEYEVLPYMPLRWTPLDGENYSRSLVEENLGDIQALEASQESLTHSMAAASTFWFVVRGAISKQTLMGTPIGGTIEGSPDEFGVISPAATLEPQIQAMMNTVVMYRQKVAEIFLNAIPSIPSGDRVTAAAIRMIGAELESGLGAPYVNISRQAHEKIVQRTLYLMFEEQMLDPALKSLFDDGSISFSVITGLQSLSRDNELMNLMRMGEIMKNMPPEVAQTFRWTEYGSRLVSALGFDPKNWVISEEEQQRRQAQQQQMAMQQAMQQQMMGVAGNVATQAASQDLQQTGGSGIAQVLGLDGA